MRRLLPVLLVLAGCNLYFDHNGDDVCAVLDLAPEQELRNPDTGQCQPFGFGGCDGSCGPCAEAAGADQALPDWGTCNSSCEALDESTCAATAGCRVAYLENPLTDQAPHFMGCWAVAPSGPVQGGGCDALDAQACSRHDDCSALYGSTPDGSIPQTFERCQPEAGGNVCDRVDCGPGAHCEQQCYPCDSPAPDGTCDPQCQAMCVPDQCSIACPPGSTCVEVCDPMTGGNCGTCHAECQPVGGACEALASEGDCVARADCRAVYQGDDCTCYEDGTCECKILTYERCETR
jgi:hypothetical protein